MIDIKLLEKDPAQAAAYRETLKNRKQDPANLDKVLALNDKRKKAITAMETSKAQQNKMTEEIAKKKRAGEDASALMAEMQKLSSHVKSLDEEAKSIDAEVSALVATLPNRVHESVPVGASAEENKIIRTVGEPKKFSFKPKEHWELTEKSGNIDFDRAGKVTGARFAFLRGPVAQLERALIQFKLDLHSREHGYEEMIPPFMANSNSFFGVGQFPKFKEDVFHLENTDYYLIPTAEVPVTNYFNNETLKESDLPIRFCAYSPCFRSEAGSYGKDTKGLIRQHQFNKVELVIFSHPDKSYEWHDKLTGHAEKILQTLELPYRTSLLCTGDISFGAAKCHDLEVWLPGQNAYREISSCSNFEDFQARRANIRFKGSDAKSKPQFVHTLNGSGLAIGRTVIAILENYQQEDGTVLVPKALQPYMGGQTVLKV